jgi:hypothetical protein
VNTIIIGDLHKCGRSKSSERTYERSRKFYKLLHNRRREVGMSITPNRVMMAIINCNI